jgi:hypothetical protein
METLSMGTYEEARQLARGPALDPMTAWPRLVTSFALKDDGLKEHKLNHSSKDIYGCDAGVDDTVKRALAPYVGGKVLDDLMKHIAQHPHWYYTGPLYPLPLRMTAFRLLLARCVPHTAAAMLESSLLGDDCLEVSKSLLLLPLSLSNILHAHIANPPRPACLPGPWTSP